MWVEAANQLGSSTSDIISLDVLDVGASPPRLPDGVEQVARFRLPRFEPRGVRVFAPSLVWPGGGSRRRVAMATELLDAEAEQSSSFLFLRD